MYKKTDVERDLVRALKQVYDPDIQVNVYDLGLIYEIKVTAVNNEKEGVEEINENTTESKALCKIIKSTAAVYDVYVKMTLTSPTCPIADEIVRDVENVVRDVPGVGSNVKIELTFTPEWGIDRMSDEAKLELGLM